ncbi:MAG TPA: hypothetical protein VFS21_05615 [Roseiflexaceae bacterium]|nr:hypothetical protein [Roseiflexaceae bacterium]
MSVSETVRLRRELLLEQAVAKRENDLVRLGTRAVLTLPGMRQNRLEESQLRNLAAVARDTTSVEVIANFIRYQIARAPNNWGTGANEFGHTIIQHLYGPIREQAAAAAQEVGHALEQVDADLHGDAYIALIRQYIGYLNRAFYFYNKTKDKDAAATQLGQVLDDK